MAARGPDYFEALARIFEHDGSITPPAAFIPVAEDSGLIVALGAQVLESACIEAQGWLPEPESAARMNLAVNISGRQLDVGDLTALVQDTLQRTGLDAHCLHIELTETAVIDLYPAFLTQLGRLQELGVQIGLDDFGTGFASLTHLRRLPLTFVKIDQSFVQGLGDAGEDERIVGVVVDLARNLGLRTIAEGVETTEQLDRLRELGCDQAQGYLFARPLSARDAPRAIGRSTWSGGPGDGGPGPQATARRDGRRCDADDQGEDAGPPLRGAARAQRRVPVVNDSH